MDKGALIEAVQQHPGTPDMTKKAVGECVTAMFEVMATAMARGEKVTVVGFGSFETKQRKERMGRNPKTGDEMLIPATVVPTFKPGKGLKERVAA